MVCGMFGLEIVAAGACDDDELLLLSLQHRQVNKIGEVPCINLNNTLSLRKELHIYTELCRTKLTSMVVRGLRHDSFHKDKLQG